MSIASLPRPGVLEANDDPPADPPAEELDGPPIATPPVVEDGIPVGVAPAGFVPPPVGNLPPAPTLLWGGTGIPAAAMGVRIRLAYLPMRSAEGSRLWAPYLRYWLPISFP